MPSTSGFPYQTQGRASSVPPAYSDAPFGLSLHHKFPPYDAGIAADTPQHYDRSGYSLLENRPSRRFPTLLHHQGYEPRFYVATLRRRLPIGGEPRREIVPRIVGQTQPRRHRRHVLSSVALDVLRSARYSPGAGRLRFSCPRVLPQRRKMNSQPAAPEHEVVARPSPVELAEGVRVAADLRLESQCFSRTYR